MLSNLSDIQHVLIKMERHGLGRERNSWACAFGFSEEFIVLFVSVFLKALGVGSAGSIGSGTKQVLSKPQTEASAVRKTWQENGAGSQQWERFYPTRQTVDFLIEWGGGRETKPDFLLMCFMCLPGGIHKAEIPANETRRSGARGVWATHFLYLKSMDFSVQFFSSSSLVIWTGRKKGILFLRKYFGK